MVRLIAGGLAVIVALLLVVVLAGLGYRAYRQHEIAPDLAISTPNGIDEHRFVEAGGIKQFITIRGQDRRNPIILFVHGGPAECHSYFPEIYQPWEKDFTIVQWDQRGAGRTYGANPKPPAKLNLAHIVEDGVEITEWLTKHLDQDKVILVGHSWGTIVGEHMVFKRPDLFSAYVGTGQVVGWKVMLAEQYRYSIARAAAAHDEKTLAKLRALGPPPFKDLATYIKYRQISRGDMDPADLNGFILKERDRIYYAPRTAPWDILSFMNGGKAADALGPDMVAEDLPALGLDFPTPFFVIEGANDHITPKNLARGYFNQIQAPKKAFFVIENAGHFVAMTEPVKFLQVLDQAVRPVAMGPDMEADPKQP